MPLRLGTICLLIVLLACRSTTIKSDKFRGFEGGLLYVNGSNAKASQTAPNDSVYVQIRGDQYRIDWLNAHEPTYCIFKGAENRLYYFNTAHSQTICRIVDAGIDPDVQIYGIPPRIQLSDSLFPQAGVFCRRIRIAWKDAFTDFYFQPDSLQTNPDLFKEHHLEGLAGYLNLAEAWPIGIVRSRKPEGLEWWMISRVEAGRIPEKNFSIPELEPLQSVHPPGIGGHQLFRVKRP